MKTVVTPGERLKQLLLEDNINGVDLTEQLHNYDAGNYSLSYRGNLSKMLNNKVDIPLSLLQTLENMHGYSRRWVQTGQGLPRISPGTSAYVELPMLMVGFAELKSDKIITPHQWPACYRLYGQANLQYAHQWVVEVPDEGMRPSLNVSARLRCQPVVPENYVNIAGVVAACFTDTANTLHVVVRRITEIGVEEDKLRLRSDNPTGVSFTVSIALIHWLATAERLIDSPVV